MSNEDAVCSFAFDLLRATHYSLGFHPFRARICGCTHLHIYTGTSVYGHDCDRQRNEVA
jgi:hypothetical protein